MGLYTLELSVSILATAVPFTRYHMTWMTDTTWVTLPNDVTGVVHFWRRGSEAK